MELQPAASTPGELSEMPPKHLCTSEFFSPKPSSKPSIPWSLWVEWVGGFLTPFICFPRRYYPISCPLPGVNQRCRKSHGPLLLSKVCNPVILKVCTFLCHPELLYSILILTNSYLFFKNHLRNKFFHKIFWCFTLSCSKLDAVMVSYMCQFGLAIVLNYSIKRCSRWCCEGIL